MFYFLKQDFNDLCCKIDELRKKLAEISHEMGEACRQSSETYHDNFPFEEGRRQQDMVSGRLRELVYIKNRASIVEPNIFQNCVSIGKIIVIKDLGTNQEETYKIGSHMIFNRQHGYISYSAPLINIISGAKAGEKREGDINGKKKIFEIIKVI